MVKERKIPEVIIEGTNMDRLLLIARSFGITPNEVLTMALRPYIADMHEEFRFYTKQMQGLMRNIELTEFTRNIIDVYTYEIPY